MNIAKRIFVICAVAVLIGWVVTGWGILLVLTLMLGLFGLIGVFAESGVIGVLGAAQSAVAPDVAPIAPVVRVSPEGATVPTTTEGAVRPSVGRRLFLDDDSDE